MNPHADSPASKRSLARSKAIAEAGLRVKMAKQALEGSWFAAEHEHPILASVRDPEHDNAAAIGKFAHDDEATQRAILHKVLPPLGNVVKARSWLQSGDLDPLRFAPVVAQAKMRMMVPPRSVRAAVVNDMVADSKGGFAEWALNALGIGLSLLSIVPGVGAVARGLAAVTGLALDMRAMGAAAGEYALIKTAGGTDIDQAHALSNEEPSLRPLIITIIGAGLGAAGLATTLRQMRQLHSITASGAGGGDDLIRILNQVGEAKGVGKLGDDVADAAKGAKSADAADAATVSKSASADAADTAKKAPDSTKTTADAAREPEYRNVEIVDDRGSVLGEFDRIRGDTLIEDKSARGLTIIPPGKTKPVQTATQWAEKQIYAKTKTRINNLQSAAGTRPVTLGESVPAISDVRGMRKLEFHIDSNASDLKAAVHAEIARLQAEFPGWTFSAKFGI